ncbi:MAG: DUF3592 domain-containing protein [Verrucomicrobiae bacterium]|nr:DUF3592 domain-containing protein [Verrucomicrobiae bacterium]
MSAGLGLSLAAMGAFFVAYLWEQDRAARVTHGWPETPCEILVSTVERAGVSQHGAPLFRFEVRYRYEWGGKSRLGDRVRRAKSIESADRDRTGSWQRRYPVGSRAVCYVNPDDPAEAVLRRDTRAALYSIWFPALFVVGGLGIAWRGVRD